MNELDRRFEEARGIGVPDLWREVTAREPAPPPRDPAWRRPVAIGTALALAAAAVGFAGWAFFHGGERPLPPAASACSAMLAPVPYPPLFSFEGSESLADVAAISSHDAWAVGWSGFITHGPGNPLPSASILHWDGSAWRRVAAPRHPHVRTQHHSDPARHRAPRVPAIGGRRVAGRRVGRGLRQRDPDRALGRPVVVGRPQPSFRQERHGDARRGVGAGRERRLGGRQRRGRGADPPLGRPRLVRGERSEHRVLPRSQPHLGRRARPRRRVGRGEHPRRQWIPRAAAALGRVVVAPGAVAGCDPDGDRVDRGLGRGRSR